MNDQYSELYASYQWFVPSQFNVAQMCAHRWAQNPLEGRRIAIYHEGAEGRREVWTYSRLSETANQLSNGLLKMGVRQGDRVALLMAQRPEAVACYMAIFGAGAIAVPLSVGLSTQALAARLKDADARVALTDAANGPALISTQPLYPGLSQIVGLDFQHEAIIPWRTLLARQHGMFKVLPTRASSPAILLYATTDGGKPVGVLLAHGALIGNLPGFVASQNWYPRKGDIFWSPAEWSSNEGLMSALLPTLYFGRSIVGTTQTFSPEGAFELMERYRVTNAFLGPQALRAIMSRFPSRHDVQPLALRAVMAGPDSIDRTVFEWSRHVLDVTVNEVYGRPEMNNIIGNSHHRWPAKPGSIGRPFPGHRVAVLDDEGLPCSQGVVGRIALHRYDQHGHPDPVLFQGYWRDQAATDRKFVDDWCLSDDLASIDNEGYFWCAGRASPLSTAPSGAMGKLAPQNGGLSDMG